MDRAYTYQDYFSVKSIQSVSSGAPRGACKYKFKTYVDERTTQPNLPFRLKPSGWQ